jgi:2-keto-4-pentenoate hydratase/2-oxohepta-3-ene-1,7-dioic acid hydratase in catechol pathway
MKLVTFTGPDTDAERVGLLANGERSVVDLHAAAVEALVAQGAEPGRAEAVSQPTFGDMTTFIATGEWGKARAREYADRAVGIGSRAVHGIADVRLRPPLRPTRLRDCIAFEKHLQNFDRDLMEKDTAPAFYKFPTYYKGNPSTVFGPDDEIRWPDYSQYWDYELELGVVIGASGVDIPEEEAESHIYGLTCFNDWSGRDILKDEIAIGLGPNKAKDFATSIGPWLVTMDEIPNLYDLRMEARVNGETWSTGNSGDIYWTFAKIIVRMADSEPLLSGEIFGSGTVPDGCALELGRHLRPGDEVELEIDGLGVLRNTVTGNLINPPQERAASEAA